MKYAVLFYNTATGSAHVPDLPGCVAAGATMEETAELMRKAIQMHLAGMAKTEIRFPAEHHCRIHHGILKFLAWQAGVHCVLPAICPGELSQGYWAPHPRAVKGRQCALRSDLEYPPGDVDPAAGRVS